MIVSELAIPSEGISHFHQMSDPGTTKHRTKMIIRRSPTGLISKNAIQRHQVAFPILCPGQGPGRTTNFHRNHSLMALRPGDCHFP